MESVICRRSRYEMCDLSAQVLALVAESYCRMSVTSEARVFTS